MTVVHGTGAGPVYDWDLARPGDAAEPVVRQVTREQVHACLRAMGHAQGEAESVPAVMVRLFAPLRRRELVAGLGASYPPYQTPAVRWHCRFLDTVQIGEAVRSTTRVVDRYERAGRRYLVWEVSAQREADGRPVALFGYVNLWEPGRAEDRQRGVAVRPQPVVSGMPAEPVGLDAGMAPAPASRAVTRTWTARMEEILAFGDVLYPPRPDNPTRAGNPHVDVAFARRHLYGGITADGNHTVAHLCELAEELVPGAIVHAAGGEVDIRFPNPCRQDDVVTFTATCPAATVHGDAHCVAVAVDARKQSGHCVARGTITLRLPTAD